MPRISIEVPADILAELDAIADENFTSRSGALRRHWREYKRLIGKRTKSVIIDTDPHANALKQTEDVIIDTGAHGSARIRTDPHAPLIDACTDARVFSSSSLTSLSPPSLPDPAGARETEPEAKTKPLPMWTAKLQNARGSWPFVAMGISSWPSSGALATSGFDDDGIAAVLHIAWVENNKCDPTAIVNETKFKTDAWLERKKRRPGPAVIREWVLTRIRTNAANGTERSARQQKRLEQYAREMDVKMAEANDDPLTEWDEAPWKKDKS